MPTPLTAFHSQDTSKNDDNNVMAVLHKQTRSALRQYNDNIAWLSDQLQQGNIDSDKLNGLLCQIDVRKTHQSPIDMKLKEQYSGDPKLAALREGMEMDLPNHKVHLLARALVSGALELNAFPSICFDDEQVAVASAAPAA